MDQEAVRLLELVGMIYDAVLRPSLWNDVMERATVFVGGVGASLFRQDVVRKVGNSYHSYGIEPYFEQLYFTKYIHHNPIVGTLLRLEVGRVTSSSEIIPPATFFETRFYKEWAKPQGLIDNVFCILERSATSEASFVVFRHERHGLTDARAFALFNAIVPHIRRAVLIGNVVQHKTTEAQGFSDLLDGIKAGVFVLGPSGNIRYSNRAGSEIIQAGDYLRVVGGTLNARQPEANQLLQDAIRSSGDGDTAISSKSVAIPLIAADGTRHLANLLPLSRRRAAGIDPAATVAVFVQKAAVELPNPPEVIAGAYQLTKTELRVLLALMQFGGGPEIADALGVSIGTVKTHLRNLFRKTGTERQTDLVRLVAGFSRPVIG